MRLILLLLRPIFHLLYHQFAWTYDVVAATVSLGRWQRWVLTALEFLEGPRTLELGFGPGHLQGVMQTAGLQPFGLDRSPQMLRQAARRLRAQGQTPRLLRGYAQFAPFRDGAFQSVVATFPSEYIFDPATLAEVRRLLAPGGRLVVIPAAWITGTGVLERLAAWLFRVTGQATAVRTLRPIVEARFVAAGFEVASEFVEFPGSQVLVLVARKN
ncbi:MAG: methyltransferase domain-containing protein [Anaerolineales bacterium]|nr:methyltransferase domain-containing protein [Anaerolineales bacterium]